MRLIFAVIVLCGVHVAMSLAWAARQSDPPAVVSTPEPLPQPVAPCDLTSPEPTFEAGRLRQGAVVEHVFTVRNSGQTRLHIERVQSSCGCTVARLEREDLEPGQSTTVHLTFKAGALVGAFHKTIQLDLKSGGSLVLSVRGRVQPDFLADPPAVSFGELKVGHEARQIVRLLPTHQGAAWGYGEPFTMDPDVRPSSDGRGQLELVMRATRPGPKMGVMTLPGKVPLYVRYTGKVVR